MYIYVCVCVCVYIYIYVYIYIERERERETSFALVARAGEQWCDLGSQQPLPLGASNSPASAS